MKSRQTLKYESIYLQAIFWMKMVYDKSLRRTRQWNDKMFFKLSSLLPVYRYQIHVLKRSYHKKSFIWFIISWDGFNVVVFLDLLSILRYEHAQPWINDFTCGFFVQVQYMYEYLQYMYMYCTVHRNFLHPSSWKEVKWTYGFVCVLSHRLFLQLSTLIFEGRSLSFTFSANEPVHSFFLQGRNC